MVGLSGSWMATPRDVVLGVVATVAILKQLIAVSSCCHPRGDRAAFMPDRPLWHLHSPKSTDRAASRPSHTARITSLRIRAPAL